MRFVRCQMAWVALAIVGLMVSSSVAEAKVSRTGGNLNVAGSARVFGHGVSCANWVPANPQVSYEIVNSIYADCDTGWSNVEVGWYRSIYNANPIAFTVSYRFQLPEYGGRYREEPLCGLAKNKTAYFSLNRVSGCDRQSYRVYVNGYLYHTWYDTLVGECFGRVGFERWMSGDEITAAWAQLKYRPTSNSWDNWVNAQELPLSYAKTDHGAKFVREAANKAKVVPK